MATFRRMPETLLDVAEGLADLDPKKPQQAALRRALSTGYYALFHLVLRACYTRLLNNETERTQFGAVVARDFGHAEIYKIATGLTHSAGPRGAEASTYIGTAVLSTALTAFCAALVNAKDEREAADYDLDRRFTRSAVRTSLQRIRQAFRDWDNIPADERNRLVLLFIARGRRR